MKVFLEKHSSFIHISLYILIWAISILVIFYFGYALIKHSGIFEDKFLRSFANWDGGHYLGIADGGYDEIFQYAFFPLYPLLMSFLAKVINSYLWAGIAISALSSFIGFHFFYKLVKLDYGEEVAKRALIYLFLFPTSFYFLTVYTESLFFCLSVMTFYFARKGNFLVATVSAILVGATRLAGLGVILSFWFLNISKQINLKNWIVILAPLGFLGYCYFLYLQIGDPLYFIRAESYWHRKLTFPGSALLSSGINLLNPKFLLLNYNTFLDFVFTIFGLSMFLLGLKKLKKEYLIFAGYSILLPLFSPVLVAIPRYMLVIFPIFIVVALIKNEYFKFGYQLISTLLLAGFSILYIAGYWVT